MADEKPPILEYAKASSSTARYDLIEAIASPFTWGFTAGFSATWTAVFCVLANGRDMTPLSLLVLPPFGWLLGRITSTAVLGCLWILGFPPRSIHKGRPTRPLILSTGLLFGASIFALPALVNLTLRSLFGTSLPTAFLFVVTFGGGVMVSAFFLRPRSDVNS